MKQAPVFSLYDLYEGQEVTSEQYKGIPLMLTFWTSWCPDSQRDLQKKEILYSKLDDQTLAMLNINVIGRERKPRAGQDYVNAHQLLIPMVEDQGTDTYERFRCQGVPTTVLITADGEIAQQFGDKTTFEEIMKHVAPLLQS
ncbi:thiol-disulfide isomerase/thioredoxin [Geomicrobium halophilum]|uniref:Thiol-disulfide isomerase/thioredoxin n=1 Tax=Geomicrobium halophilum TaxID=549000 RepID=A0A841PY85_9BACL|nr:TlpA disulfide reductase family protein [Geomicrobium halophilum]MBB6449085.1 thiol-disulfide isomerase/thioredoxin [Geomicrobium halophilum]